MDDRAAIVDLQKRVAKLEQLLARPSTAAATDAVGAYFGLNAHAFVSRYARGRTGKEKFTLLVAYLAKGEVGVLVSTADVQKLWSKMTAATLLGMQYNGKYANEAKTKGWINSPKSGTYELAYGWQEVLAAEAE